MKVSQDMDIREILRGESRNVEFKELPPKNSEKYTKTVIAFANTQGGHLIFGVEDETREIVGIEEEELFPMMDNISNAISDSCEPQIVPSIEPYTIDGKTVIIVTVLPEPHRPYYMKSKGRERGTYIRVAGTTRLAGSDKIKDLEMEGAKISWDELICVGYEVTDHAVKKLCHDINARRKEMQERRNSAQKLSLVKRVNLENWKILKKTNNGYLASNAFVLLTSDYFQFSRTQCAVFKGNNRNVFLDKREYTGPLYEQIDDAMNFVLRNIRLGARIEGIQRKESYELPVEAIREMIVNAHCHRNMRDESCVQVAIYDDRLEVTSPGGLYNGLTFEEALQGHSKLRNRAIANIFSQIGLVEAWGTGLQRIKNAAKEYGLPEPEFIEMPDIFRVNLFRASSSETKEKLDSGTEKLDSGTEKLDSGTEKLDYGTEKLDSGTEKLDSGTEKLDSGTEKLDLEEQRTVFVNKMKEKGFNRGTIEKTEKLFGCFGSDGVFGGAEIMDIVGGGRSTAFHFLGNLKKAGIIVTAEIGKGKYHFKM